MGAQSPTRIELLVACKFKTVMKASYWFKHKHNEINLKKEKRQSDIPDHSFAKELFWDF